MLNVIINKGDIHKYYKFFIYLSLKIRRWKKLCCGTAVNYNHNWSKRISHSPFRASQFDYYNSHQKNALNCIRFTIISQEPLTPKYFVPYWTITRECNNRIQDRQCTFNNVTLRRVRASIVAVEKEWVLLIARVCVYTLRYSARNAHAPYCHLWPPRLYNVFPHYFTNGEICGEKKLL